MINQSTNTNVHCTVGQCEYNGTGDYCSLDSINIGTHESNPTLCECVDCNSFKKRSE